MNEEKDTTDKKLPIPPLYVPGPPKESVPNTNMAQDVLLKALSEGITDPKELAKLASLKKTADVYVVLDKLSLRKEFHAALARAGMSLDFIVTRLKKVIDNPSDEVALKGISAVLKTMGLDKHEDSGSEGKAWEDVVLDNAAEAKEVKPGVYEVVEPPMPESLRKRKEEDAITGKKLYE